MATNSYRDVNINKQHQLNFSDGEIKLRHVGELEKHQVWDVSKKLRCDAHPSSNCCNNNAGSIFKKTKVKLNL